MAAGGFHYLQEDAALAGEADAAGTEFALQAAGGFVIDAFTGGDAMCGGGGHGRHGHYTKTHCVVRTGFVRVGGSGAERSLAALGMTT